MSIEVLVSCMNQDNMSIVNKLNLRTDALIINQCDHNSYIEEKKGPNKIKMISCDQRGLTRSRNLALANASGEICILCDDDVTYVNNYDEIILKAFADVPDADIIVFNIDRINYNRDVCPIKEVRKAPRYKSYGSVQIAFRLSSLRRNNIWFDINFGAGSIYSSGEESLLLKEAYNNNLKVYEYPAVIAKVDFSESTWREGYNKKFFYDKGALLSAAYPRMKYVFMFYYIYALKSSTKLPVLDMLKWLIHGMEGYKHLKSYDEYVLDKELT